MNAYCLACQKITEMENVRTVRLPNLCFIHKGACALCSGRVYKGLTDRDILVDKNGRHYPAVVYRGDKPAESLVNEKIGQVVVNPDLEFKKRPAVEAVNTLKSVKINGGVYEKENLI